MAIKLRIITGGSKNSTPSACTFRRKENDLITISNPERDELRERQLSKEMAKIMDQWETAGNPLEYEKLHVKYLKFYVEQQPLFSKIYMGKSEKECNEEADEIKAFILKGERKIKAMEAIR